MSTDPGQPPQPIWPTQPSGQPEPPPPRRRPKPPAPAPVPAPLAQAPLAQVAPLAPPPSRPGPPPPVPLWPTLPPPAAPSRSGRARWWVLGSAALVLVILGGVAAVALWPKRASAPPVASAPSPAATAKAAGPGATASATNATYKGVSDLCGVADLSPLRELYPMQSQLEPGGSVADMWCHAKLQSQTVDGRLAMEVTVLSTPAEVRDMYDRFRTANRRYGELTEVSGLGTGAYWHQSPAPGTELVAYDGNLYFRVLWTDLLTPNKIMPDLVPRLAAVARNTMVRLRI
jgi:hypothetical protein